MILLAHFDRPKGKRVPEMSLPEARRRRLAKLLGSRWPSPTTASAPTPRRRSTASKAGGVLLLENVRFHAGEEKNDPEFADAAGRHGDLYVNDAFSAAHRAHASTEGLARAAAGLCRACRCSASWTRWTRRSAIRSGR